MRVKFYDLFLATRSCLNLSSALNYHQSFGLAFLKTVHMWGPSSVLNYQCNFSPPQLKSLKAKKWSIIGCQCRPTLRMKPIIEICASAILAGSSAISSDLRDPSGQSMYTWTFSCYCCVTSAQCLGVILRSVSWVWARPLSVPYLLCTSGFSQSSWFD